MEWWPAPGLSKPSFDEATKQRYTPIAKGHRFGPSWSNHWLRVTIKIKPEWRDKERVQFEFDPGCSAPNLTGQRRSADDHETTRQLRGYALRYRRPSIARYHRRLRRRSTGRIHHPA